MTYAERTLKQNNALHKFFASLAKELNRKNLGQRKLLKEDFFIGWTEKEVKRELWEPISKALDSKDETEILLTLVNMLVKRLGINRMPLKPETEDITIHQRIAEFLNDAGFDQRIVLKQSNELLWDTESIKERLWRPFQIKITGEESTADVRTVDYDIVYKELMRNLSCKHGVYVEWPSWR